jgi:dTDP-4-amino-4,6-dideoxygalactose transaminase
MDRIMDIAAAHGLAVVEDCAQAVGATWRGQHVGTLGDIGCYSFFPSKNLGAMGDGGMVVTDNPQYFERVEMLRRHGGRVKYHHEVVGVNSRLDEIQAAILRVKLPYLDTWNDLRRGHAHRYNRLLSGLTAIQRPAERSRNGDVFSPPDSSVFDESFMSPVYHQYTIEVPHRDKVVDHLRQADIGCHVYYPVPLHQQQAYAQLNYGPASFPHAERAATRCMSLPMFPELQPEQQSLVAQSLSQGIASQQQSSSAA